MIARGNALPKLLRRHGAALAVVLLCSVGAVLPLLIRGPSCGHDFDFHLLSWMEAAHDWHAGLFDPHWLATANYGAGEPRFVFYPPASWLLGSAAGAVTSWTLAPVVLTFAAIFFAGVCVYWLALSFANRAASLAAACVFLANPYLLFVAYERTAYGELLATGLIALLLLLALRHRMRVVPLACVVAALWLTNAPAAVMGCYTLGLVAVIRSLRERAWSITAKAAAGCALGSALAGFYLVPAAFEQRWVQIERAVGEGMRVEDSFLFEHTGAAFHDQVLHTASILAVIILGVGLAAGVAGWRTRNRASVGILVALLVAVLLLQFPFSAPLWHAAPHLAFLQFPWRWLLVASVVAAALVSAALPQGPGRKTGRKLRIGLAMMIMAASVWFCSRSFYQPCDEEDAVAGQLAVFRDGTGVQGTDEYTATGADNGAIERHLPEVRLLSKADAEEPGSGDGDNAEWVASAAARVTGSVQIGDWQPESKRFVVRVQQPGYAVMRLMDYPAWLVTENGAVLSRRPAREDGLLVVPIAAGVSTIEVHWKTTADVWWGRGLSLMALLILAVKSGLSRLRLRRN